MTTALFFAVTPLLFNWQGTTVLMPIFTTMSQILCVCVTVAGFLTKDEDSGIGMLYLGLICLTPIIFMGRHNYMLYLFSNSNNNSIGCIFSFVYIAFLSVVLLILFISLTGSYEDYIEQSFLTLVDAIAKFTLSICISATKSRKILNRTTMSNVNSETGICSAK